MRWILSFVCAACCLVPNTSWAEPTPEQWALVMNVSGRQRMLTQKMCKEALFITADVNAATLRDDLTATKALFEKSLLGLRDGDESLGLPATENPRIVKQLDKVKDMYLELKPILEDAGQGQKLSAEQLKTVADLNLPLLKEMNKAVKMYERGAKKVLGGDAKSAVVINLAGKQRMLTQKMTKESLLVQLGVDAEDNRLNLRETTSLFSRTLTGLMKGDDDLGLPGTENAEIRSQLTKVQSLWSELQPHIEVVLGGGELNQEQLAFLSEKNVPLLKEMNKAVKMFELAAK